MLAMDQKNIAIIGNITGDFIDFLNENDYYYSTFLDSRRGIINNENPSIDFSNVENVINAVISTGKKFTAVVALYEEYIQIAAQVSEKLGINSISVDSAIACTDKTIMRGHFHRYDPAITPEFAIVGSLDDAIDFAGGHEFPMMLKPANLAKSLLVTKVNSIEELGTEYFRINDLIGEIYQKYAPREQPKILIEEYLDGSIHSIDVFVDGTGQAFPLHHVVDYVTGFDIGFDDNFHYARLLPSKLSASKQQEIKECAVKGVTALGMKYSPAHVEIIMTKKGPKIVEIGARNGGYRQKMHKSAHGINLYANHMAVIHGKSTNLDPIRNDSCALLEVFPKERGLFAGLHNQETLETLSSLRYLNVRAEIGDEVGKSGDGFKRPVVIMLHNSDSDQFNQDLEYVNQNVWVKTA